MEKIKKQIKLIKIIKVVFYIIVFLLSLYVYFLQLNIGNIAWKDFFNGR